MLFLSYASGQTETNKHMQTDRDRHADSNTSHLSGGGGEVIKIEVHSLRVRLQSKVQLFLDKLLQRSARSIQPFWHSSYDCGKPKELLIECRPSHGIKVKMALREHSVVSIN